MIVFFEKAMNTRLPLQNKLRTYRKKKRKNKVRPFFSQSGLDPPPPTAKPDEKFLDPRVDIRYHGGIETISLLNTFYSAAKIYNAFNVYRRELAPGTVSLTGDRAQGDNSKHWAYFF